MSRERDRERSPAKGRAVIGLTSLAAGVLATTLAGSALALPPGESEAQLGIAAARFRNCAKAIPLLEEAERIRHMPSSASALADCYVLTGALLRGSEIYHQIMADPRQRTWTRADYGAVKGAVRKAAAVDARLPTVRFLSSQEYEGLAVKLDGKPVSDLNAEARVAPDVPVRYEASAKGRRDLDESVVLHEGEKRVIVLRLAPAVGPVGEAPALASRRLWLGVSYLGTVLPRFLMNTVVDGGRTVPMPGAALTLTAPAGRADVRVSLGYMSLRMGDTSLKPKGTPDTEWEIDSSTLQSLMATVEVFWSFALDSKSTWSFRLGGGAGVGWTFTGDLFRTQAYPVTNADGKTSHLAKCKGPDDPIGTFRYCNTLDKDATHYNGYAEPDWFHHGVRPLVYPWLALPELGLSWRPASRFAVDLDTGFSLQGFVTSVGVRVGL